MIKVTVLYGHPAEPKAFEEYYPTHLAIATKMTSVIRRELTKFLPAADGSNPAYYRMAELYFNDLEALRATLASPEGQAAINDVPKFATGGATFLVGKVD